MNMSRESKLIVFVAVLASLLEIIDSSIVNVAIPSMMGNLGATLEDISMVVTGYAIANAIVLPVAAWLGDRLGRRTYYLGAIVSFTLTSVACGFAPNLTTLIIFRILQGLAGGALLPTSQALIYEQFPKEKAGMAGALFGMSVMIGPTLGPTLGGYLTDQLGWRSIFNINLPLGILALVVGYAVVKNVDRDGSVSVAGAVREKRKIDAVGLGLIAIGIGCLQYMLERGEADDWFSSNTIVITGVLALICLPLFVWWELRVKDPIINVRLFKDSIVANGTLLMTALGFFLYAIVFVLPIFVARVLHYDATQTGTMFIPGALLTALMMPFIGKAMQKIDPRALIFVGFIVIEACVLTMTTFSTQSSRGDIMTALYIRGFGMAFLFVPINSSILSQFKGIELGQVSGLLNLSRQIGGSIGIALVGTLLTMRNAQNYVDISSKVSMLDPVTQLTMKQTEAGLLAKLSSGVGQGTAHEAALRALAGRIGNQVFMLSFTQLMYAVAIIFLLAFIPLARLKLRARPVAVNDSH